MVEVIFLGTNGWFDTKTGNTISILIKSSKYYIVLDAGNGIYKLKRYAKKKKPVYVFLSHFHLDHIEGLHTLPLHKSLKEISIITPRYGKAILKKLINHPFTKPIEELSFRTNFIEVPRDAGKIPFKAEFLPMRHSDFTLGTRLELDGKIIAYCPDTGYCGNALALAKEADLLITECSLRGSKVDENWPHLNPLLAARIAKEARAKKLVMAHFDAAEYTNLKQRKDAVKIARKIFRNSYASKDGMEIIV